MSAAGEGAAILGERRTELECRAEGDPERRLRFGQQRPGVGGQQRADRRQGLLDSDIDGAPHEAARIVDAEAGKDAETRAGLQADAGLGGDGETRLPAAALYQAAGGNEVGVGHRRGRGLGHDAALDGELLEKDPEQLHRRALQAGIVAREREEVLGGEADAELHAGSGLGHGLQADGDAGLVEQVERHLHLCPHARGRVSLAADIGGEYCRIAPSSRASASTPSPRSMPRLRLAVAMKSRLASAPTLAQSPAL